ncbi:uncharacterized protein FTJAE_11088 [Fusarium tjaetaba]|uniref:Uncharacterized protein n=1 Tax=Fusarium tjaetaba TaxID=1567544 RepID=A0A8H5VI94_9HYPO|nr:uncharacterized protein FTJAE_11088 [Fusarium tjaetaba]KAF5622039.1 hypothetical protein FTJAE_11088 [Fusarium tjaetaba]
MNRLPRELVDAILQQCIEYGPKNAVLDLRLVCRVFDQILKPFACRTLDLEFSRLSKTSGIEHPQIDALQTIGYHCKSLYIDLMVLRDDLEVEFLDTVFARVPSMADFCQTLHKKYCMNETSFTETDYYEKVEEMLFYCRDVDRLRLNLPFQLVGRHCNAATMILANTLKAFAQRPEEDSAKAQYTCLLEVLEHLVLTLRRHENEPITVGLFGSCLWNLVENAGELKSLCLVGMDHDDRPPRGLKQTKFWQMPVDEWRAKSLPAPNVIHSNLTCLELKRIELCPEVFVRTAENFGTTLRELYLNEVYLKVEQSRDWNEDSKKILWVGMPNQRPGDDCHWIAMALRCATPHLRICRASFLAYDHYMLEDIPTQPEFDLIDPCGLGRSISQRFVEVVMGIRQPTALTKDAVEYLPADALFDSLLNNLLPRNRALGVVEYDTNAYQTAVANSTSEWQRSIDGVFPNCNSNTLDELHFIAETACEGMSEIHRRRNEWSAENSMANEFTENLFNIPPSDDEHV